MTVLMRSVRLRANAYAMTSLVALTMGSAGSALAQAAPQDDPTATGAAAALLDDVVVTARKRPEDVQNVPVAVTAYGATQLDALNFRDIGSLGYTMPNVALDDNGTSKGYANFSIRGVGINSSIPSLDPAVGVFVDGVYQGINAGQVFDNFDLEAIEVLRGPQGVFFGRNVTGGAIIVRTARPKDHFEASARVAVESGLRTVVDGSVSGPLVDGRVGGKLAAYYTHDDGWFTNKLDGAQFGKDEQFIIRPMLTFTPNENLEFLLRFEHGEGEGDGPPTQNHALYSRDSHDFLVNNGGFYNSNWNSATLETNWHIPLGDGTITNIFGWRQFTGDTLSDLDGVDTIQFNIGTYTDQEQYSNELRYAGTFGRVDVTTGLYYFTQDLLYLEDRTLAGGAVKRAGGGFGTFDTFGAFAAADWHFTDTLTLNLGVRYTKENKEVSISTVRAGGANYPAHTFTPDFADEHDWNDVSPRVGIQWQPSDQTSVYAFYAKGFRSGGYNFRNTLLGAAPGPFNSEASDNYEAGIKQKFPGGRGNVNFGLFQNTISDIQRDVQVPVVGVGIAQLIQNVGEARFRGAEIETTWIPTDNLVIAAFAGYTEAKYTSLTADLTGDGVINAADYALHVPRQSPWTYGANATLDVPVDFGVFSGRVSYSHRDKAFHTDNNLGYYNASDQIDLNIQFKPNAGHYALSVYGKNLTDETTYGNDSVLPDTAAFGGDGAAGPRGLPTFSPLARGRVIGAEVRWTY